MENVINKEKVVNFFFQDLISFSKAFTKNKKIKNKNLKSSLTFTFVVVAHIDIALNSS